MAWLVLSLVSSEAAPPDLARTFTNATPSADDLFGRSVAALSSDRVVIGASGRSSSFPNPAAYLFTAGGGLQTTFTNPAPGDNIFFGEHIAAVGADHVIIGSYQSGITSGVEKAYLFDTSGAVEITFTNPPGPGAHRLAGLSRRWAAIAW